SDVSAQKRAAKLSASVQRITEATLGDIPLDDLLHDVLLRVQEALQTDFAMLLVGKAQKGEEVVLRVRAVVGPHVEIGSVALRGGFGVAVATERRAKVWTDLDQDQMFTAGIRGALARSLAGVPLLLGEQLVGVLEVASLRVRHFTDEEVNLLRFAGE